MIMIHSPFANANFLDYLHFCDHHRDLVAWIGRRDFSSFVGINAWNNSFYPIRFEN
jgi:hypothetical protein